MTPEQEQVVNDALRGYAWAITSVYKLAQDGKVTQSIAVDMNVELTSFALAHINALFGES